MYVVYITFISLFVILYYIYNVTATGPRSCGAGPSSGYRAKKKFASNHKKRKEPPNDNNINQPPNKKQRTTPPTQYDNKNNIKNSNKNVNNKHIINKPPIPKKKQNPNHIPKRSFPKYSASPIIIPQQPNPPKSITNNNTTNTLLSSSSSHRPYVKYAFISEKYINCFFVVVFFHFIKEA